jgi:hypothetical protein
MKWRGLEDLIKAFTSKANQLVSIKANYLVTGIYKFSEQYFPEFLIPNILNSEYPLFKPQPL